ncbi:MAG: TPM domain-containing protein, partial [Actinobacteria bacterium]
MPRPRLLGAALLLTVIAAAPAAAQSVDCGEYEGVVCQGYFTDEAGVVADRQRIEDSIARLVAKHGSPIAVVVVTDSRGRSPGDFAVELADAWGVGDPEEQNGILVLVSLEERRVDVATQPAVTVSGEALASSARTFFQAGDYEGGLLAIAGALDQILSGTVPDTDGSDDGGGPGLPALGLLALFGTVLAGIAAVWMVAASRRSSRAAEMRRRQRLVDTDLAALEPSGHELPAVDDYALAAPSPPPELSTRDALAALQVLGERGRTSPAAAVVEALWSHGLVVVLDRQALLADTREPLELRATQERPLLEDAVQAAADDALAVDPKEDTEFRVRRQELADLVASLRPHRVAAARRRTADTILAELVATDAGHAGPTAAGRRLLAAGPALDPEAPVADSLAEIAEAYETA